MQASVNSTNKGREEKEAEFERATERTENVDSRWPRASGVNDGEFDPGSERTLAARLKHASRANPASAGEAADG